MINGEEAMKINGDCSDYVPDIFVINAVVAIE
jgi:hypothetical protein